MATEEEEFEFRARAEKEGRSKPSSGMQLAPIPEAAMSIASMIPAGAAGLAAGTAGMILPGERGQGQRWMQKTQQALTYEPRDEDARGIRDIVTWPARKLSDIAQWAGESAALKTGQPFLGSLTESSIDIAPSLLGLKARDIAGKRTSIKLSELAAEQKRNAVADANLKEITDAGYVYPPSKVDPTFLGKKLESVAGKAALNQESAIRNQGITQGLARKAAGLADDEPITPVTLKDARERISEPYRQVAALSTTARAALEQVKQARAEAKAQWKHYNRSAEPESMKKAKAFDAEADFYEQLIEQEATAIGRTDLLPQLRQARVELARNYDVERALNSSTGEIDARVIGRMYEKDKGKRMTGELATIGKFANKFKALARPGSDVPTPGVHNLEAYGGLGLGLIGHEAGLGWWPAGMVLAGGPARAIALSKMMQKTPSYNPSMGLRMSEIASKGFSLTPALGLRPPQED